MFKFVQVLNIIYMGETPSCTHWGKRFSTKLSNKHWALKGNGLASSRTLGGLKFTEGVA